jgi:hypothetical protein
MSRLLSYFLAGFLALALIITGWAFILSRTLGNAAYLEKQADQTSFYQHLATAAPDANIDPEVLRTNIVSFLPALIDHFVKNTPAPTVDINGAPFPVTLGPFDDKVTSVFGFLHPVGLSAPFIAIGLILLVIAILRDRRLPTIARGTLQAAISLLISAGFLWVAPALIMSFINQPSTVMLKPALEPFLTAILHDMALQLAVIAAVLALASVIVRVVHHTGRFTSKFMRHKPKPETTSGTVPPPGRLSL